MNLMQTLKALVSRRHARKVHSSATDASLLRSPRPDLSAHDANGSTPRFYDGDSMPPSNSIEVLIDRCLYSPLTPERLLHLHYLLSSPAIDPNVAWDAVLDYLASESFPSIPVVLEPSSDLTSGKWQWMRYLEESGTQSRMFAATAPVGLPLASSPSRKLLLDLPYDVAYKLQSYLSVESLGRIRQTCRQLAQFPMDFDEERRLLYALTHENQCRELIQRMTFAPSCTSRRVAMRIMVEAIRHFNVPLALQIINDTCVHHCSDRFWFSWALFLAIAHATSVSATAQQSAVGQILHALLLHPSLPNTAWFLLIPAMSHVRTCLESTRIPHSLGSSTAHTLLSLLANPSVPTPKLAHPLLSIQTRLLIGLTLLSAPASAERITSLYQSLTRATTSAFQQSTVDHWLFLFSVQSGNVSTVKQVLAHVRPRALAVKVAGGYVRRMSGAGWMEVAEELERIEVAADDDDD